MDEQHRLRLRRRRRITASSATSSSARATTRTTTALRHQRRDRDRRRPADAGRQRATPGTTCTSASATRTSRSPACTRTRSTTREGAARTFADHQELYWDAIGNQWPVPIDHATVTVDRAGRDHAMSRAYAGAQGSRLPCDHVAAHGAHARRSRRPASGGRGPHDRRRAPAGHRSCPTRNRSSNAGARSPTRSRSRANTLVPAIALAILAIGCGPPARVATRPRPPLRGFGRRRRVRQHDRRRGAGRHRPRDAGPVEFVPPDGVLPGQVGTLVDEHANLVDVTATIVDLAVRGWLTITDLDKRLRAHRATRPSGRARCSPTRPR